VKYRSCVTGRYVSEYYAKRHPKKVRLVVAREMKYAIDVPTIPKDEPVILFRAQDVTTPALLEAYAMLCLLAGCNKEFIDHIRAIEDNFRIWQGRNPDRVKVPD
jgi:fructose 1,6-bisphosphatase